MIKVFQNLNKNRTIVSKDSSDPSDLAKTIMLQFITLNLEVIFLPGLYLHGMSIKLLYLRTVKIYGYKDSNLFLAPYSVPLKGKFLKKTSLTYFQIQKCLTL